MPMWEMILMGMGAAALLFFFWPGAKRALEQSRQAENPDWKGALLPVAAVVIFVILLILMARG